MQQFDIFYIIMNIILTFTHLVKVTCNRGWHDCDGLGTSPMADPTSGSSHGGIGGPGTEQTINNNRKRRPHDSLSMPQVF